ncbi:MAG: hypothetical protein JWP15_133 [Alphaproteobacteria bacterium]|nr:hypothetical protein [Alphaproteobacteria bacterium]
MRRIHEVGYAAMLCLAASAPAQIPPPSAAETAARAAYDALPVTQGSGPYPAIKTVVPGLAEHVVYRPRDLARFGRRKLGVLLWGNGGCRDDGASARFHLTEIASHGFLVIAPGRILSGPGAPPPVPEPRGVGAAGSPPAPKTSTADVLAGLDWALAENRRAASPYYGRIDPSAVAVSGHSCGGLQAIEAGADPRIHAVIIHNSGIFADGSNPIRGITVDKSMLRRLHTPILYVLGGPGDVAWPNGSDDVARIDHVPVVLAFAPVGHGGTFREPNGGKAAAIAVDWLDWQLRGDRRASKTFLGKTCGLCGDPVWKIQRKGYR